MYICTECGNVFEKPGRFSEDRTPGLGASEPEFLETYYGCPSCGSAFEQAMECQACKEVYIPVSKSHPFCDTCINRLVKDFRERVSKVYSAEEFAAAKYPEELSLVTSEYRDDEIEAIWDNI